MHVRVLINLAEKKRYFDTTPRFMAYCGVAVMLSLLAMPYWLDWFPAHSGHANFSFADEASPTAATTKEVSQSPTGPALEPAISPLSRFGQVRLDAPREEMLKTFDLHAVPNSADREIYETTQSLSVAQLTACFSNGTLQEAVVIEPEKPVGAAAVQQELIRQYGRPTAQTDDTRTMTPPQLLSSNVATDWVAHMASLPFQRSLVWNDANYRIEASIHYSSVDPAQSRAILIVHLHTITSPLQPTLSQCTAHPFVIDSVIE